VKKPVSKFAFQVHNLQRYNPGHPGMLTSTGNRDDFYMFAKIAAASARHFGAPVVGRCRLNPVGPTA
jgi:hypothetical protein